MTWTVYRPAEAEVVAFLERANLSEYTKAIVEAGYDDLSFLLE